MTLTIAVPGVTGRLGGRLAELLLEHGHQIRALVRDQASPDVRRLQERGATIVRGDFDDRSSLEEWAKGADVLFITSTPHHGIGTEAETRHAIAQADAARAAGVGYVVYSSSAGADRPTRVPFMESKRQVEEHLRSLGLPHAVVAPVYCMDNVRLPWNLEPLRAGRVVRGLPPSLALQQVAIADVAEFCALAIERQDALRRHSLGDRLRRHHRRGGGANAVAGPGPAGRIRGRGAGARRGHGALLQVPTGGRFRRRHRATSPGLPGGGLADIPDMGRRAGLGRHAGGAPAGVGTALACRSVT